MKLARLLAVLVALFVPLQGMVAVAAGQCMAFGHHHDGGGNSHAHDGGEAHDHGARPDAKSGEAEESGTSAHCGPCTACCASVSIAPVAGGAIPPAPAIAQFVFLQFPPTGIRPDGVYRPPLPSDG